MIRRMILVAVLVLGLARAAWAVYGEIGSVAGPGGDWIYEVTYAKTMAWNGNKVVAYVLVAPDGTTFLVGPVTLFGI